MFRFKLRHILTFIATIFAISISAQNAPTQATTPPVVINASADSSQVTMGGRTVVHVELVKNSHNGVFIDNISETTDQDGSKIHLLGNTEIRQKSIDSTEIGNGRIQVNYTYMIQPFDVGTANIGPFKYAHNGDTIYSPLVSIKVLEPPMPQMMRDSLWINPMENVVSISSKWYDVIPEWWYWPVIALVVIALIALIYFLYKKNGARLIPHKKKVIPPYPLDIARLKQLKNKRLAESGHTKEYYTELTDILREYLHGRFGIYAREMTSPQIIEACQGREEIASHIPSINELLTTADFVKFAKQSTETDENIRSFNSVSNFVEATKPVEVVEDAKSTASKTKRKKKSSKTHS